MSDLRPTLADPDDDPFLWLEQVEGNSAIAWADAQSRTTMERFGNTRFIADRDELCRLLDRPDNLPVPMRRGGLLYNFWKDAEHPRGIWRRTTLSSFRTPTPDWDILLDLDALATAESEDWIWQGAVTLPPSHACAMLRKVTQIVVVCQSCGANSSPPRSRRMAICCPNQAMVCSSALTRSTQNPLSSLWKVTRSTRPANG